MWAHGGAVCELWGAVARWFMHTNSVELPYGSDGSAPALPANWRRQGEGERMEGVEGSSSILAA
jgi:hypothetical protein